MKRIDAQGAVIALRRLDRLFVLAVLVPTALALVYFGLIASDVYVSESRFVVRSSERQMMATGLGSLLQGAAGFGRAQDDSFSVHDYVQSRDALKLLDAQMGLGKAYAHSSVDRFSRFGGVDFDDSFEGLYRYYQKMVGVQTDSASSITVLTVRAFTAQDARRANELLLEQSEALVNRLNSRARADMVSFAAAEVAEAESKARAAAYAVSAYRNAQSVVDPERQASVQLQQVAKIQEELIATTTMVAQLQSVTPANPQIPVLKTRAEALRQEMNSESTRVAGGAKSLANKAAEFQRLALEREFADKQLATALASLETARNDAQRKQVYLERIAEPSMPDVPLEPKRIKGIVSTFLMGMVLWGILTMLIAGIREHQD